MIDSIPTIDFDLKGVSLGRIEVIEIKAGWRNGRCIPKGLHRHSFHEIIWLKKGREVHTVDTKQYILAENHALFIPKGSLHDFVPCDDLDGYKLIFDDACFNQSQWKSFKEMDLFVSYYGHKLLQLNAQINDFVQHSLETLVLMNGTIQKHNVLFNLTSLLENVFVNNVKDVNSDFLKFVRLVNRDILREHTVPHYSSQLGIS